MARRGRRGRAAARRRPRRSASAAGSSKRSSSRSAWCSGGPPTGEESSRVEIELEPAVGGTRVRVVETRPLSALAQHVRVGPAAQRGRLMAATSPTDRVFAALSDRPAATSSSGSARRGEASATQLARDLPISRQAIAKHLASLAAAGLIADRRDGREVLYRVTPAPMSGAMSWMATVGGEWDESPRRRCAGTSRAGDPLTSPVTTRPRPSAGPPGEWPGRPAQVSSRAHAFRACLRAGSFRSGGGRPKRRQT